MARLFELHRNSGLGWRTAIWADSLEQAVRAYEKHIGKPSACVELVMYRGCLVDRQTAEDMQKVTGASIEVPYGVEGICV